MVFPPSLQGVRARGRPKPNEEADHIRVHVNVHVHVNAERFIRADQQNPRPSAADRVFRWPADRRGCGGSSTRSREAKTGISRNPEQLLRRPGGPSQRRTGSFRKP